MSDINDFINNNFTIIEENNQKYVKIKYSSTRIDEFKNMFGDIIEKSLNNNEDVMSKIIDYSKTNNLGFHKIIELQQ